MYNTGYAEQYARRYMQNPVQLDCDNSVMTYRGGHEVLRTLIRCRFSPEETTGQRYIYSGSSDGDICSIAVYNH